jgi:hypothetical protein
MNGIDWLRKLHTKQLLNLKKDYAKELIRYATLIPDWNNPEFRVSYEELKQVLSERPHIPRGSETKQIRQASAKYKIRSYQSPN